MGNMLVRLANQVRDLFFEMPTSRRLAVLIFMGLVVSSMVALMIWARRPDYQVLYSGLSQSDASAVVSRLQDKQIPYRVEGAGIIKVPANRVREVRLVFAEEGVPSGGAIGFEIFDRSSLGVTDFVQRVNFLRALQGELARTITQLSAVNSARVHVVMPERALFAEDKRKPTASVVVSLARAASLPKSQVKAIIHLVASAVDGLGSENVTVVDTRGNVLAGGKGDEEAGFLTATQMELKAGIERRLENRVETMLARVVGPGRVVARVDVELNMRRVERTREIFDPDKQVVRSERRVKEKNESGRPTAGGIPGVQANVPESERGQNEQISSPNVTRKSSRTSETVNFEIDKTIERIVEPMGDIKRISAAVMVDGIMKDGAAGAPPQFEPRSKAEIDNFKVVVAAAIGINTQRGDSLQVISIPFGAAGIPGAETLVDSGQQTFILTLVKYVLGLIGLALIFFFVVRPLLTWISTLEVQPREQMVPEGMAIGPGGELLPEAMVRALGPPEPEVEITPEQREAEGARRLYEQVYEYVSNDPGKAADIIRGWVRERV
ncbi:MAG: flagellar basal-body MS-ring/collar protein FliF [bacterium]